MTSATIYQFPAGGRSVNGPRREAATPSVIKPVGFAAPNRASPNRAATRMPNVVFGGAWYHDEAIREAEQASNS
jgi:uncharacterized protein DUF2735